MGERDSKKRDGESGPGWDERGEEKGGRRERERDEEKPGVRFLGREPGQSEHGGRRG